MNLNNQNFQNSLRCLQQPATLLSILLLLVNDHVLKIVYPSWLTGKLSDFAGLFFFPFIVAAGLSLLFAKFTLKPNTVRYLAFVSITLWFALFKTLPIVNHATNILLSKVVNHPVQLVIDGSDTLALIMLWPAWRLWNQSFQIKNQRISYAPLILGLFACIATSPPAPVVEVVTHFTTNDESIFAIDSINSIVAESKDGGRTWKWTDEYDFGSFPTELKPLPITVCPPDNQEECYRINGQGTVEETHDAGRSWEISWQWPVDRLSYMKRIDPDINLGPYDLLITEWDSNSYILVAAGEEGILQKELPDGEWNRIAVQNATPTPYKSTGLTSVISILWKELLVWFFVSIIIFIVACGIVRSSNSKTSEQHLSWMNWIFAPALSPILGIFLTLFIQIVTGFVFYALAEIVRLVGTFPDNIEVILSIALVFCIGMAVGVLPLTVYYQLNKWRLTLMRHNYPRTIAQKLVWTAFLSHIIVFATGALIWLFWTIDIISSYSVTLISALITTILSSIFFLKRIANLSRQHNSMTEKTD